jgi:hypothetical protein
MLSSISWKELRYKSFFDVAVVWTLDLVENGAPQGAFVYGGWRVKSDTWSKVAFHWIIYYYGEMDAFKCRWFFNVTLIQIGSKQSTCQNVEIQI